MNKKLALGALVLVMTTPACADQQNGDAKAQTAAQQETGMTTAAANDPANPYMSAEMDMKDRMMAAKGADAAETWARKMIEHHKGALSMSKIALKEADDAMVRQMAQKTIDMQTKDIAELQKWLKDNGKAPQ